MNAMTTVTTTNRVSLEQRRILFSFMQNHEDLARGKILGPDAARKKKILLLKLAKLMNAMGTGARKTPEKWLKCWQDWKSDTKAKYIKLKKARNGTGAPMLAQMTPLEEKLLQFFGMELEEELVVTPDLLTIADENSLIDEDELKQELVNPPQDDLSQPSEEEVPETPPPKTSNTRHHRNDRLQGALERQAAAAERQVIAAERKAEALERIAAAAETGLASLARIADGIDRLSATVADISAAFRNRP